MVYRIGVSSGWWHIGRDPSLLGLALKAGFIATAGVTVNQVDLESTAEFLEPKVKENFLRIKKELGLTIGMHAEIGENAAMESAERRIWEQAHLRLVETIKNAPEYGVVYINLHLSTLPILQYEEARIRPFGFQYQVVAPDGSQFWKFAEKSEPAKKYIKKIILDHHMRDAIIREEDFENKLKKLEEEHRKDRLKRREDYLKQLRSNPNFKQLPDDQKRYEEGRATEQAEKDSVEIYQQKQNELARDPEQLYDSLKRTTYAQYILEAGEIDAYLTVAHDMHENNDPLWTNIVGNMTPERAYVEKESEFNAAIAARYLEGHLRVKDNKYNKRLLNGMSVLEWAEKSKVILCFEIPEVERTQRTTEGNYRLFDPRHSYWFVKKIGSSYVKLCIDFEHMLGQKLDPYKIIPLLPGDFGKQVYLFHLGEPKPYWGIAHIPIPLGSQAQEVIYDWLYMLRQTGFKDGILIFERGSGRGGGRTTYEVFEQSVLALRQIAENLEKGIPPKELPLTFYGMSEKNEAEYKRELVNIRDHAWDPLEGVLSVPEEKHTFFSRAAVEKQKGQEWEKRKFR